MKVRLLCTAALLRSGNKLAIFSDLLIVMASLAIISGDTKASILLILVILLGIVNKYYSIRVSLDAELFELMAKCEGELQSNTQEMDACLFGDKAGSRLRSWHSRELGAQCLFKRQCIGAILQGATFVAAMITLH